MFLRVLLANQATKFTDIFPPKMTFGTAEQIMALKDQYHQAESAHAREDTIGALFVTLREAEAYSPEELEQFKMMLRSPQGLVEISKDENLTQPSHVHYLFTWFTLHKEEVKLGVELISAIASLTGAAKDLREFLPK